MGLALMTADILLVALLAVGVISVVLALSLFAIKVIHRRRLAKQELRRNGHVVALGEILARDAVPEAHPADWETDPAFLEVLFEYVAIVTGTGLRTLHELIDLLRIRTNLIHEVQTARRSRRRLRSLIYLVEIAQADQRELFLECLDDRKPSTL